MNINREPYRDDDYVWRCQHGKKLHLACDDCEDCQREEEVRVTTIELVWWGKLLAAIGAVALGWAMAMQYNGLLF